MTFKEWTLEAFVLALQSKAPTPGGGGAAALSAAIGCALGSMVGSLTVGKKKYADAEPEVMDIMALASHLQEDLLKLMDADAECFAPLAKAYGLPAETPEEKRIKEKMIELCSKDACEVPLQIMRHCCRAIELTERMAQIGSRLAASDAGCSAAILKGALEAASLNIFINTKGLKDRSFADSMNREVEEMLTEYTKRASDAFSAVRASLL